MKNNIILFIIIYNFVLINIINIIKHYLQLTWKATKR